MDLLDIQTDKVLIPFARNWIKKFPNHEVAPRLAGKWLRLFGSNDAMYLSISYMRTYPDLKALKPIVLAAAGLGGKGKRLFDAIEKRMDKDLRSHIWGSLQTRGHHQPEIDVLMIKWINHNVYNEDIVGDLSSVALFTDSLPVLEEILRWVEMNQTKQNRRFLWMVLSHLLRGESPAHQQISPRVIEFARGWLQKNSHDEAGGTIHRDVIFKTRSLDDIRSAIVWFESNPGSRTAESALSAIMKAKELIGDQVAPDVLEWVKNRS